MLIALTLAALIVGDQVDDVAPVAAVAAAAVAGLTLGAALALTRHRRWEPHAMPQVTWPCRT